MNLQIDRDIEAQIKLIADISNSKLENQIENLKSIDTKASILSAIIGFMLVSYFQLFTSDKINFKEYKIFIFIELILFIVSGYFVSKSFLIKNEEKWRNDPEPSKLISYFFNNYKKGISNLRLTLVKAYDVSFNKNIVLLNRKYNYLLISTYFLFGSIIITLIHLASIVLKINY